jgi:hypothetical protein
VKVGVRVGGMNWVGVDGNVAVGAPSVKVGRGVPGPEVTEASGVTEDVGNSGLKVALGPPTPVGGGVNPPGPGCGARASAMMPAQ